jgi:hypothetical protein
MELPLLYANGTPKCIAVNIFWLLKAHEQDAFLLQGVPKEEAGTTANLLGHPVRLLRMLVINHSCFCESMTSIRNSCGHQKCKRRLAKRFLVEKLIHLYKSSIHAL